jgi:tetratricopeptide (TPR) repeat protein
MWKLTDFGLSSTATSKHSIPTQYSRGTSSYRAPELLGYSATVTNKVDIWGVGCILHELATSKVAFYGDPDVQKFRDDPNSVLQISMGLEPEFVQHHVSETIRELLHKDPRQRPRASFLEKQFVSYSLIATVPNALQVRSYPSYPELRRLAENHPTEPHFTFRLAEIYEQIGEHNIGMELLKLMVRKFVRHEEISKDAAAKEIKSTLLLELEKSLEERNEYENALAVLATMVEVGLDSASPTLGKRIANVQILNGQLNEARQTLEGIVQKQPTRVSSWCDLCDLHLRRDDYFGALIVCEAGIVKYPDSPAPAWVEFWLHSAKGEYEDAVTAFMNFWDHPHHRYRLFKDISDYGGVESKESQIDQGRTISTSKQCTIRNAKTLLNPFAMKVKDTDSTLRFAAWSGNVEALEDFIKTAQNINERESRGWTPLHLAAWNMHGKVIQRLLKVSSIEINARTSPDGWTALHMAVYNNDLDVTKALLRHGADVDLRDRNGSSSAEWAAKMQVDPELMRLLERANVRAPGPGSPAISVPLSSGSVQTLGKDNASVKRTTKPSTGSGTVHSEHYRKLVLVGDNDSGITHLLM